jgi:hypothetical protein
MDKEPIPFPETQIETKRLAVLIDKYKKEIGGFDIVPVGNAGYILQSSRQKPMAGNDWVLFDYDDTLVATTEVKKKRLELYCAYIEKLGIDLTDVQAKNVVEMTDKFSRWEDEADKGNIYHANVHMAALQWATNSIRESQEGPEETIDGISNQLKRIKTQQTQDQQPEETDPFYFRPKDKKFILRGADKMWSKGIEDIFMQTMINPPQYDETIEAVKDTGQPRSSIHRINTGIFTYGDPYYQLLKVFELIKKHPDFAFSQIWLTRVPKGEFVLKTVEENATSGLEQDYVPPYLEEYPGEGMSGGSGYILGPGNHVIVMMDDSPKELESIVSTNMFLFNKTGAQFVTVRSKRAGTKEADKSWQVVTKNGELDFSSREISAKIISDTFLINRYLAVKRKLGDSHPNTIRLKTELTSRGVNTNSEINTE